jgi:hypothetical protein
MTDKFVGDVTPFPIVGMGASAGGLEAFEAFFRVCPADTGMGFVLVPHLDPGHASLLSEILQRSTTMPVEDMPAMLLQLAKQSSYRLSLPGTPPYDLRYQISRQDGTQRDIRSRALPMPDASGRITHLVGTSLDVTP